MDTENQPPPMPDFIAPVVEEYPLNARRAFVILLAFFGVQMLVAIGVGIPLAMMMAATGTKAKGLQPAGLLLLTIVCLPCNWIVAVRMAHRSFPKKTKPEALRDLGWTRGPVSDLLASALIGLTIVMLYRFILVPAFPPVVGQKFGPLATAMRSPGWTRYGFALMGVCLAPPVEEFVFRGVMFEGFRRSWGTRTAAVVVTGLFVLLHLTEARSYWPALLGITALAAGTIITRIHTRSLAPGIAMHAMYNLALPLLFHRL